MNDKEVKITALFCCILLLLLLSILWLTNYSRLDIPEFFPGIAIGTYTLLMAIVLIVTDLVFQKVLLRINQSTSVLKLMLLSTAVIFIATLAYQIIRQQLILQRPFSVAAIWSFLLTPLVFILISLSTALSLKKASPLYRVIPFAILIALLYWRKGQTFSFDW